MENDRTVVIGLRVGADERRMVAALASLERVKLSEAVRLALREAAKARGLWPPAPAVAALEDQRAAGEAVRG